MEGICRCTPAQLAGGGTGLHRLRQRQHLHPSYSPADPYVASASGSTYAAYAVGFLPIPLPIVDFFAKVGFAGSKFDKTVSAPQLSGTSSIKDWEFAWGLGVQAHLGIVGARLEYEQLDIPNSSGAKIASLSAFLNF